MPNYLLFDGFLFRKNKFCISIFTCSIRELLVKKAHRGGLMEHFGINKPYDILSEHFYWPMVYIRCVRCTACKEAKSKSKPH